MNITDIGMIQYKSTEQSAFERSGRTAAKKDELKEVCLQFEAIFVKQMLNSMKSTVNKSGLTDGGMAEDFFEDMLYDSYAEKMARNAGFGIGDMMYKQLSRQGPEVLTET